jgi:hypothetical protein
MQRNLTGSATVSALELQQASVLDGTNSVGEIHYPAQRSKTLGAANAVHPLGPS